MIMDAEGKAARVAIVGAGPAGLMAAERLSAQGVAVDIYEAMPSPGRKFLLAGRGGLNLTHTEAHDAFVRRYGERAGEVGAWLAAFDAEAVRAWAAGLGVETFVGSSGRVFPTGMKAAPLLRAWLARLAAHGASLHVRHRWQGWSEDGALRFSAPAGERQVVADAVVLALGGASWPRMGTDGRWAEWLRERGIAVAPWQAANAGFQVGWSEHFIERHAGEPLKDVAMAVPGTGDGAGDDSAALVWRRGECMATRYGLEGGLIYALGAALRQHLAQAEQPQLWLDLLPQRDAAWVEAEVRRPRGARSWSSHLQSRLGLKGVKMALLRECLPAEVFTDPRRLAAAIKCLPVRLSGMRPVAEAISSAGGVEFAEVDRHGQLLRLPGVFCAGEMLDWEAPTGGYLLTACLAGGAVAAEGVSAWLRNRQSAGVPVPHA
ncbi:TIGR03862 family flavoprotein [Kerstersia gyiorum]|nr:TIGR03862 family flavoprotein [Kerstersia gyiorum]